MLLAFPQGTGKTVISLASSEKLCELGYINSILILSPPSITWQWIEKIKEFTDHEDVRLVSAKDRSSREYDTHKSLYTIVPYSVFRKDSRAIEAQSYDLIIADEAQEFSAFRSKTFKLIKRLRSEYRWALTGTAISNKLEELYAILNWVDPYFLPPWKKFERKHLVRNPNTQQILKYKNLAELNKYLTQRVERKSIDELQGLLPEVITHKIYVEKDKQVQENEKQLRSILSKETTGFFEFDPDISRSLHGTRQALCGIPKLQRATELLRRILSESDSNRVVVFSFYKRPLYELQDLLDEPTILFTGDQDSTTKQEALERFRGSDARILLCSNAGKAGLDIPFANYTIHLDVPFSYGIADQRSTRTRRISSEFSTVVVIYLLVKDSIEDYYYQVTINKGNLAKATLEGGADKVTMKQSSLKAYLDKIYS